MCKFESLYSEESRGQPADYLKACSKPRAFNCLASKFKTKLEKMCQP